MKVRYSSLIDLLYKRTEGNVNISGLAFITVAKYGEISLCEVWAMEFTANIYRRSEQYSSLLVKAAKNICQVCWYICGF